MNEEQLKFFLDRLPSVDTISRSGENHFTIPCIFAKYRHPSGEDRRPSMTVSISPSRSFVWCWSCGYKKPLVEAMFELNSKEGGLAALAMEVQQAENNRSPVVLTGSKKDSDIDVVTDYTQPLIELYQNSWSEKAVEFLLSKGVELKTAKSFNCAFAPKGYEILLPTGDEVVVKDDLIIFPILTRVDDKLTCVGAQCRYVDPTVSKSKYFTIFPNKSKHRFFGEQIFTFRQKHPIFLTEGALDAMHVTQEGFRAVGNMGLGMTDKKAMKLLMANPPYVVILLDPDFQGQQAVANVANILKKHNVPYITRKPTKDPKYLSQHELKTFIFGETSYGTV